MVAATKLVEMDERRWGSPLTAASAADDPYRKIREAPVGRLALKAFGSLPEGFFVALAR